MWLTRWSRSAIQKCTNTKHPLQLRLRKQIIARACATTTVYEHEHMLVPQVGWLAALRRPAKLWKCHDGCTLRPCQCIIRRWCHRNRRATGPYQLLQHPARCVSRTRMVLCCFPVVVSTCMLCLRCVRMYQLPRGSRRAPCRGACAFLRQGWRCSVPGRTWSGRRPAPQPICLAGGCPSPPARSSSIEPCSLLGRDRVAAAGRKG